LRFVAVDFNAITKAVVMILSHKRGSDIDSGKVIERMTEFHSAIEPARFLILEKCISIK
jgi:hypothetical protein